MSKNTTAHGRYESSDYEINHLKQTRLIRKKITIRKNFEIPEQNESIEPMMDRVVG